jgi:hypothetical protein
VGSLKESEQVGYVRLTALTDTSYDIPAEWLISAVDDVRAVRVDLPAATAASAKPAFRAGNAQAPVSFDELRHESLLVLGIPPSRVDQKHPHP